MAYNLTTAQTNQLVGIAVAGDYVSPASDKLRVQVLIDLIRLDATMIARGLLDQISPGARWQLLKELTALYDNVT